MSDFYFKCRPTDFLKGIDRLNEPETAAYTRIVMLYYERGGPLPDRDKEDERWFASKLKISVRKWCAVRDALIAKERIWKDGDGSIRDDACDETLAERAAERERHQANGASGGRKRAENLVKTSRKPAENELKTDRKSAENSEKLNENSDDPEARLSSRFKQLELESDNYSTARAGARGLQQNLECELAATGPPDHPPAKSDHDLTVEELMEACLAAAGPGLVADQTLLRESAPRISAAIAAGCSLALDIAPVVAARTAKARAAPIATFAYFEPAWADARRRRLAAFQAGETPPPRKPSRKVVQLAPPPNDGPPWWREAGALLRERLPQAWTSYFAGCVAGEERGALFEASPTVLDLMRNRGVLADAERALGFALDARLAEQPRLCRDCNTMFHPERGQRCYCPQTQGAAA